MRFPPTATAGRHLLFRAVCLLLLVPVGVPAAFPADTVPPQVFVFQPTSVTSVAIGGTVLIQVQAMDDVTPQNQLLMSLSISRTGIGGPYSPIVTNVPYVPGTNWTVTGPATTQAVIRAQVADAAHNVGTATSQPFTIRRISRSDARNLVTQQVILSDPAADSLVAYLWHSTGPDSLLPPGTVVTDRDSSFIRTLVQPTYLGFLDEETSHEWDHASRFVFIDATTGQLTQESSLSWPRIDGVETFITRDGNTSPDRFYGTYPGPGPDYQYETTTGGDNTTWALVAVGANVDGEDERKARKNDVNRIRQLLNGASQGPQISGDHIRVVAGSNYGGTSAEELCAALDSMQSCGKLYFFYTGHGAKDFAGQKGGLVLNGSSGTSALGYEKLACKLLGSSATEVCVVIEACYSGDAVKPFGSKTVPGADGKPRGLKGVLITSSPDDKTTHREGDGAPFYKALLECMLDPQANLDGVPGVSLIEAIAWAIARNPTVAFDGPKVVTLGDGRTVTFPPPTRWSFDSSKDGGGSLHFVSEGTYYRILKGAAGGRDSLVCRRTVYVENPMGQDHVAVHDLELVCKRPDGGTTVIKTFRVNLKKKGTPGDRACIADVPAGCGEPSVRRASGKSQRGPAPLSVALPDRLALTERTTDYNRGEYVYQDFPVTGTTGQMFNTALPPLSGWNMIPPPASFTIPPGPIGESIVVRGSVPDTASQGGYFDVTLFNVTSPDTFCYRVHALRADSLTAPLGGNETFRHRAFETVHGVNVAAGTTTLTGCRMDLIGPTTFNVASGARMDMTLTTIRVDSAASASFAAAGTLHWDGVGIVGATDGLHVDGAVGRLFQTGVLDSRGDGLSLTGSLAGLEMSEILIDGSAGDGLVADGATGVVIRGARVFNSAGYDVRLSGNSTATLVDAEFDAGNLDIEPGSTLGRSWSTLFLVRTPGGTPLPGVVLEAMDAQSSPAGAGTTSDVGLSEVFELAEFRREGSTVVPLTPHTIHLTWAGMDTTVVVTADTLQTVEVAWWAGQSGTPQPPTRYRLLQNDPNPFQAGTRISFDICARVPVSLAVFDATGRLVRRLLIAVPMEPSRYSADWNGRNDFGDPAPAGVYFYRLEAGGRIFSRRMIRLR